MSGHAAAERYTYQGSFVHELLEGAKYDIFFGAFGTGILGVKKLLPNKTYSPNPGDHYIILFVNVQGSGLSVVTTSSTMTTYHNDSLDKERNILRWYSQASDRESVKAQFIIDHATAGSPVVVATRRNAAGSFSLLGIPRQLVMVKEAHLATAVGDMLLELEDDGDSSDKYHKAISANCLIFPKKVSSIRAVKATEEILTSRKICIRCCVMPAAVDMVFDEMNADGLAMFEEEDENRRRKLVKKKPVKPERNVTRTSEKVLKAQKKAELLAKREAKKAQKVNPDGDAALGKLVSDASQSGDKRRARKVAPKRKPKKEVNHKRRRLRGRTELLPSEIASLPPLPEGMIDILDGMLIKATSSADASDRASNAVASPVEAAPAEAAPDEASDSAGRKRGLTELLDVEESPFEEVAPTDSKEHIAADNEEDNIGKSEVSRADKIDQREPVPEAVDSIEESKEDIESKEVVESKTEEPTVDIESKEVESKTEEPTVDIESKEVESKIEEPTVDVESKEVESKIEEPKVGIDSKEVVESKIEEPKVGIDSKEVVESKIEESKVDIDSNENVESTEDVATAAEEDIKEADEQLEPSPKRVKTD